MTERGKKRLKYFGLAMGFAVLSLDFSFKQGTLGALFFNPARRYAERLKVSDPWSRQCINYPLTK